MAGPRTGVLSYIRGGASSEGDADEPDAASDIDFVLDVEFAWSPTVIAHTQHDRAFLRSPRTTGDDLRDSARTSRAYDRQVGPAGAVNV